MVRRLRLTRIAMIGLVMAVVTGLIGAACGGGSSNTPTPAPTATTAATPTKAATAVPTPTSVPPTATPLPIKRGGILRSSILAEPTANAWNILQGPTTNSFPLFEPVLSSVVQFDIASQKVIGDLAESWTTSGDGTVITFKIRDGVTWHDGVPLKASDIKYNMDATFFGTLGFNSQFVGFFGAAKSVEAPDARTVVLTLTRPSNSFFSHLTHGMMLNYPPQVPQDELKAGKVIGTNAYTWANYQKNIKLEERAYAKYWDKGLDGKPLPYLDGIDWFVIGDTQASIAAFRTGQVDMLDPLNGTALIGHIDEFKAAIPGLIAQTSFTSWRMILTNSTPPLDNVNVRKAIAIGID
ncbi:MAG: ABC transporter substrate-binding protein, partial [Chloroflexi bacterium]|nr:ABC transporter substrate-binding protein [Chloroflexota bacterium]